MQTKYATMKILIQNVMKKIMFFLEDTEILCFVTK